MLLDSCVWGIATTELLAAGHDVIWAGAWPQDPGDEEILSRAHAEGRILVTLDNDFGALAVLRRQAHSGLIRLVGVAPRQQAPAVLRVLSLYSKELEEGAIVTVGAGRIRIRPGEPQS